MNNAQLLTLVWKSSHMAGGLQASEAYLTERKAAIAAHEAAQVKGDSDESHDRD